MKRCPECRNPLRDAKADVTWDLAGAGEIVMRGVPGQRCDHCGEVYRRGEDLERAELVAAAGLADIGVQNGAVFRFMRKALGMRAADLAELLDVTAEQVSRWENDHVPVNRGAWVTVAALVSDRLEGSEKTLARLRALREHRTRLSSPLRLDLAHAR
ncbi:MAG TPA: YgiT-type zinc finger protein [Anaeromyxobacter sp.]|nr:YgiT-type zinc finger protein [Anaeromyxobacter sp.]